MKPLKLVVFCLVMTVITAVSWMVGTMIGNGIAQTVTPPTDDPGQAGLAFLAVCVFNSILYAILLGTTRSWHGSRRMIALTVYVFTIQFLLPQMETFFFASGIGIGYDQASAIFISGVIVSLVTTPLAVILYEKLAVKPVIPNQLKISITNGKKFSMLAAVLIFIGYPLVYLTFGYFIAWQNESLRVYYTESAELASYGHQLADSFTSGVYVFQVLRGAIWIGATIPVAVMLKEKPAVQYFVVGVLSALLPTQLLFIPNPFMPWDIAMTHFVETSTSNFVWGLMMVWVIRKSTMSNANIH